MKDKVYGGEIIDVNTLPIGTEFEVHNGAWLGKIIEHKGQKYVECYTLSGKFVHKGLLNGKYELSITVTNYGSTTNTDEFEYGGYHFLPERKFTTQEKDFFVVSKKLASDAQLGLCVKKYGAKSKFPYTHKGFYKASGNSKCDIFKCMENSNLYVPCENELFRFV